MSDKPADQRAPHNSNQGEGRVMGDIEAIDDRAKTVKALDALESLCDSWCERIGGLQPYIDAINGKPAKIAAMLRQCWMEGAYEGRQSADQRAPEPTITLRELWDLLFPEGTPRVQFDSGDVAEWIDAAMDEVKEYENRLAAQRAPEPRYQGVRQAINHLIWTVETEIQGGRRSSAFIKQHRAKIRYWIEQVRERLAAAEPREGDK